MCKDLWSWNKKVDFSEYGKDGTLKSKIIYTYSDDGSDYEIISQTPQTNGKYPVKTKVTYDAEVPVKSLISGTYREIEEGKSYTFNGYTLTRVEDEDLQKEIDEDQNEIDQLESEIREIEYALEEHKERDVKEREERKKEHKLEIEDRLKKIKTLKDSLKDKLNFHSK